jgi:hypothetical protein
MFYLIVETIFETGPPPVKIRTVPRKESSGGAPWENKPGEHYHGNAKNRRAQCVRGRAGL